MHETILEISEIFWLSFEELNNTLPTSAETIFKYVYSVSTLKYIKITDIYWTHIHCAEFLIWYWEGFVIKLRTTWE
jgi:hypothetical protein